MALDYDTSRRIKTILATVGITAVIAAAGYGCSQTAGCSRMVKSLDSDFNDGLTRVIYVYFMEGELEAVYAGKFDIDYSSERIIFDDENNKRHQIFIGTGSAIIDEVTDEELVEIRKDGEVKVYTKGMD